MAENQDGQEKSEDATEKKLSEAREKGSIPKSQEVNTTAVMIGAIIILYLYGGVATDKMAFTMKHVFSRLHEITITYSYVVTQLPKTVLLVIVIMGPILFFIMFCGLISNYAQVGILFTLKPLEPKFSKLNPISGIKKVMLSKKSAVELVKNIIKLVIVAYVAYSTVFSRVEEFPYLIYQTMEQLFTYIFDLVAELAIKIVLTYLFIAAFDYWFQKYDFSEEQKMTKQEVKDESKQMEGNPEVKGKIKSLQRRMAMNRMMADVPDADVVITNPTHYAVALKYDAIVMTAPTVTAKGVDLIAQKIKKIAKENDVTIVENVELARALYKTAEVGDSVPEELFQAVAEVLAFVYKLKGRK